VVFPSFCHCFGSGWEGLIILSADNWSLTLSLDLTALHSLWRMQYTLQVFKNTSTPFLIKYEGCARHKSSPAPPHEHPTSITHTL